MAATWDLGDSVPLTFYTYNDAGQLADATTVAVTVTLPDGTTAGSPWTPVHAGTGVYTLSFPTSQAGRHDVRALATGAVLAGYVDAFNVNGALSGMLISLDQARSAVQLPAGNTNRDEDLRLFIMAATPIIEDIVGPVVLRTITQTFDGGVPTIHLAYFPVDSITSVTEVRGITQFTITSQPLGGAQDGYGYTFDPAVGVLTRRATGAGAINWAAGADNVTVTYVAGRRIVPANVQLATRELVRHLWQTTMQTLRPQFGAPDQTAMSYTPSGFAVPKRVIELLSDLKRPAGMA